MTNQSTPDREAFEKWADKVGHAAYRSSDGRYANFYTQHAWESWQAALESRQVQEPVDVHIRLRWADMALELVGNGLRNRRHLTDDDIEVVNLTAARRSISDAQALLATPISGSEGRNAVIEELSAAEARNAELGKQLEDAIDSIEGWAAYASDYFQQKHGLAEELAERRAALKSPPTERQGGEKT